MAKDRGVPKPERLRRKELIIALQESKHNLGCVNSNTSERSRIAGKYALQRRTIMERRLNVQYLAKQQAMTRIVRWYRYWKSIRAIEDPITLEKITHTRYLRLVRNHLPNLSLNL